MLPDQIIHQTCSDFSWGPVALKWPTLTLPLTLIGVSSQRFLYFCLTRKHAWVHDSCWLLKHLTHILSLLSAPSGQSNLVKLPQKIQPAVQMKSRMYGNWGTPTLQHFTEEREGEGMASMKDTVFALPEFRTCWLQSTHYKLWKFMQINIWRWLRRPFAKDHKNLVSHVFICRIKSDRTINYHCKSMSVSRMFCNLLWQINTDTHT